MFNWFYAAIGVVVGIAGGMVNMKNTHGPGAAPMWTWNPLSQPIVTIFIIGFLIFSATFGLQWFFVAIGEIILGMILGKILNRM
jgi:hypothetical protein